MSLSINCCCVWFKNHKINGWVEFSYLESIVLSSTQQRYMCTPRLAVPLHWLLEDKVFQIVLIESFTELFEL